MSTKATLAHHHSEQAGEPSWHFYEELFEAGVVYLELRGVSAELQTLEQGGADVVVRLPIETAKQLGLHINVLPSSGSQRATAIRQRHLIGCTARSIVMTNRRILLNQTMIERQQRIRDDGHKSG